VRTDRLRALLLRTFGKDVLIDTSGEAPIDAEESATILDLASKLPAGDAIVVQRHSGRGAYPPIGRPAVTSVAITPVEISLTSASRAGEAAGGTAGEPPALLQFARGAVLSAAFTQPPRIVGDLNRLFGAKVSSLFDQGGVVAIYDVDMKKLLPRPLGVIVLPILRSAARRRSTPSGRPRRSGIRIRTAEIGNNLAVSFDDSIDQYQMDAFDPAPEANQWSLRIDAPRLVPILNALHDNLGLRLAAPRIYRSARDLGSWIGELEQAKTIEATDSIDAQTEILHVRIAAK
jgi:hypothetical protein